MNLGGVIHHNLVPRLELTHSASVERLRMKDTSCRDSRGLTLIYRYGCYGSPIKRDWMVTE